MTTVDREVARYGMQHVDVLKIDTEGYDPTVLSGAYLTLLAHRVSVVTFEYNSFWQRVNATLQQCVRYMDDLGYVCFYDGRRLYKISGTCWDDRFELRKWTNIVCVARGSVLEVDFLAGTPIFGPRLGLPEPRAKPG
ncbi:hypothetical protein GPECTOR_40g561 [Gonium pectorale]|uniref:Methyltransferase FkbM domain-containing protein n=1 Tax=Gonium pectorale TaxID=33097 RepID=A0A150GAF4_GONPE|nr:hypothetical protein GPECTOR_40g561 [Gonium pectorale]|eukprot:KXZ46827.1 hypothetical protein GPECTOR_40g561 [Gonium pectorale]